MGESALIVARMVPSDARKVARLFAESDTSELPAALGVRCRRLFSYQGLYFHYVEFAGGRGEALRRAADRPDFTALSTRLAPHVTAYDPATWRGPADAVATEFYTWHGEPREASR